MREIKFRAFDPKKGMFEPYSVRNGKAFIIKQCGKDDPVVTVDGVSFYCNWDIDVSTDFPVMQFTGLKDTNGVDVYESDILCYPEYVSALRFLQVVEIGVFDQSVQGSVCDVPVMGVNVLADDVCKMVVIGNIYQNPELLK